MGYIFSLLPFMGPLGSANALATIFVYLMTTTGGTQAWLHVILALNRLTAILFPRKYKTIWEGKNFVYMIALAFAFPAIIFSWILYFGGTVDYSPLYQAYVVDGILPISWVRLKILINTDQCCPVMFRFLSVQLTENRDNLECLSKPGIGNLKRRLGKGDVW